MTLLATSIVSQSNVSVTTSTNAPTGHSYVSNLTVDEFKNFAVTVRFEDITDLQVGNVAPPATYPVSIKSVSIPTNVLGVTASFTSNTVTISGAVDLNNVRSILYLSENNTKASASTFTTLPESYRSIYNYSQASSGSTTSSVGVSSINHALYSLPLTVVSNDTNDIKNRLNKLLSRRVY